MYALYAPIGTEFVASVGVEPVTRNRSGREIFFYSFTTWGIITYLKIHFLKKCNVAYENSLVSGKIQFYWISTKSIMKIGGWKCKTWHYNLASTLNDILPLKLMKFPGFSPITAIKISWNKLNLEVTLWGTIS